MGYYVTIEDSNLVIPADKVADAYELLCALNADNTIKGGWRGDWRNNEHDNGPDERVWFSWMPWNYPEVYSSTEEILDALGFEFETIDAGILIYGYDNKTGDEEHFLAALAPVVVSTDDRPAQIVWRGEDSTVWRQILIDGAMVTEYGRLVFSAE